MGKCHERTEFHKRLSSHGMQTVHVAGDYALHANFGTTAAVTFVGEANDRRGVVVITCGGTGQGASPTCTLTFKDGAYEAAPVVNCIRYSGDQPTIQFSPVASTTAVVFTFNGTASGTEVYRFQYQVVG